MTGSIFSVERYALHDGPGIRTQVFFKGCPLRCLWCANPEGISFRPSLMVNSSLCAGCGACVEACPVGALSLLEQGPQIDRELCTLCGDCAAGCYAGALEMAGSRVTAEEVVAVIERDRAFYQAGEPCGPGGVTLCGGEPLAQAAFARELLRLCKAHGLHTAVETCGHYPFRALAAALPYLDLIYFDLKQMDAAAHRELTGVGNGLILANLEKLQACAVEICVRVPVIPTFNDGAENLEATARFLKRLPRVRCVELLPYHRLGANKYRKLGLTYPLDGLPAPGPEEMAAHRAILERHGLPTLPRPRSKGFSP